MQGYEKLEVWRESFELTCLAHHLTKRFPTEEKYTYTSQIRRAALSIPSNIAEGKGRLNDNELHRFCVIAYGSAMELDTQLRLTKQLQFAPLEAFQPVEEKLGSVLRLLNAFIGQLCKNKPAASRQPACGRQVASSPCSPSQNPLSMLRFPYRQIDLTRIRCIRIGLPSDLL